MGEETAMTLLFYIQIPGTKPDNDCNTSRLYIKVQNLGI